VIRGDVSGNGMFIVPNGEIKFGLAPGDNRTFNCSGPQRVSGIFITNK
jgi:hypothetical protein